MCCFFCQNFPTTTTLHLTPFMFGPNWIHLLGKAFHCLSKLI
jgi:hypothetical protein